MTYQNLSVPFIGLFLFLLGYKLDGANLTWVITLSPLWTCCCLMVFLFIIEKIFYIFEPVTNNFDLLGFYDRLFGRLFKSKSER